MFIDEGVLVIVYEWLNGAFHLNGPKSIRNGVRKVQIRFQLCANAELSPYASLTRA
jgi:hypothetical protein